MDVHEFLGLEPGPDPSRWRLPVTRGICGGRESIYGGCGLAAAVEAAEAATGRPLAWGACQFLRPAHLGSVVDLRVDVLASGRAVTHGRVVATVEDQEVFATLVSLGERDFGAERVWPVMPDVPPPERCPPRYIRAENKGGFRERVTELAVTDDPDGMMRSTDGRCALWVTMPGGLPARASALALFADDVSAGVSAAVEPDAQAPSLDNTVRVVAPRACDWVLADVEVRAVARGLAHGTVNLWSADGHLLAVAGQTGVMRIRGT
jgi:acyl-CoA thioesterase